MTQNDTTGSDQPPLALVPAYQGYTIDIPNALVVRLQTLDLARHVAIAPNGKRYVVATFDDRHLEHDYITAVYPQQNEYLTLVRLIVCTFRSETPDQALSRHVAVVQAIQNGKLNELIASASS